MQKQLKPLPLNKNILFLYALPMNRRKVPLIVSYCLL